MKNKRHRLQIIVDIIRKTCIGSQSELSDILNQRGVNVTQATLSRDLKSLKITKVANDYGKYMYIIPDSNELQDTMLMKGQRHLSSNSQIGFVSFDYSGNIAIVKTRNGYATGLAYDIDMSHSHIVLGTIAGADTVFVLLREGVSREEANEFFSRFIPAELIEKEWGKDDFIKKIGNQEVEKSWLLAVSCDARTPFGDANGGERLDDLIRK